MDIQAYKSHSPPLAVKLELEYVKMLTKSTIITPLFTASTADTAAQVIILGHNHLAKMGLNISCLHRTETVMDCANSTVTGAMGVFFGCVRGQSEVTGKMLVQREMVYVIEGDIVLLSQTALQNLGVIPKMLPIWGSRAAR